ncbi:hypothetical protein scyTo_0002019 [Scyliorhinus torazame]|uniref:Phospholipid scramblase n=1 Tax=Scyliorhinus torazame TaxID=75743 RepID=A0A401PH82_SCYTO|nr:hypothetical protein [Scyliorhinus torazame]
MAAQGPYSYPAYGNTAPTYPPIQHVPDPYPPPLNPYGVPPAGYAGPYAPQPGYAVYPPPSAPMLTHQAVGPPPQPQVQWMQTPAPNSNCPPGLEYLTTIDQLLVHQIVELVEALTGFETKNKYELKNSLGQRVYYAVEDSEFCNRLCCGSNRAFVIKILDNVGHIIMHLVRPLGCGSCCCPCCLHQVVSLDESSIVGKISKQWSGIIRECLTDTDNFGIQFPMDLDVKIKAVLLGACLLVDFMYFEKSSGGAHGGAWRMF